MTKEEALQERKEKIVKLALEALSKSPERARFILSDLYDQGIKDFEAMFHTHGLAQKDGSVIEHYERRREKWNPTMG